MGYDLKPLLELEKELRRKLEENPLFIQWNSLKTTIGLLENGVPTSAITPAATIGAQKVYGGGIAIPVSYSEKLTWREKILFALYILKQGTVHEIIAELKKNGVNETDEFLQKRVSTMASAMKSDNILDATFVGNKAKYFIK